MKIIEVLRDNEAEKLTAGNRAIREDETAARLVNSGHARIVDDVPPPLAAEDGAMPPAADDGTNPVHEAPGTGEVMTEVQPDADGVARL